MLGTRASRVGVTLCMTPSATVKTRMFLTPARKKLAELVQGALVQGA